MFQFHKVRLKALADYIINLRGRLFQFHKVRLKASAEEYVLYSEDSFNSIRFD